LEACIQDKIHLPSEVSIPLWFDWKGGDQRLTESGLSFNSTLVRLEEYLSLIRCLNLYVSIPLWFDWKFKFAIPAIDEFLFQFHFGSIGSMAGIAAADSDYRKFQFHFGSIGRFYCKTF